MPNCDSNFDRITNGYIATLHRYIHTHFWAKTTWFGTGTPGSGVCCCYLIVSGNQEGVNGHMCHQEVPSFWTRHRWSQRVISLVPGPRVSKGNRLSCRGKESKFKVISQYHSQLQASEAFQVNGKMLLLIFYFLNLLDCICFSSLHILIDSLLLFYIIVCCQVKEQTCTA
jgi:hypothetical protein